MPDGLEAPTGPAAFAQFAVHPHARTDEERDGRGDAGEQNNEAETLAAGFAELVGDEQSGSNADGHFRRSGHGGRGEILGEPIEGIPHNNGRINDDDPAGNRNWRDARIFPAGSCHRSGNVVE